MNKIKYSIGELVQLKSGGPVMTVMITPSAEPRKSYIHTVYTCQWFAGKKLEKGNFPEESLKMIEEND